MMLTEYEERDWNEEVEAFMNDDAFSDKTKCLKFISISFISIYSIHGFSLSGSLYTVKCLIQKPITESGSDTN